ncbi:MAG: restriction endonuclease subunit S [Ruminococcus sp.]
MKSEWKECTLKEIINFKNGKKKPVEEGIIPVYGGNGVLGYVNQFNLRKGIAIGRVGAYCGSVYYSDKECWISDNAIQAINNNNSDILFDYYLLKFLRLNERRIGTGQPLLTQEILNRIEIQCPPLQIQRKIASILFILDNKIKLNNQINENLELQAQAIFKAWFIDFEPFGGVMPEDWSKITLGEIASISTKSINPLKQPDLFLEHYSIPAFDEQHYPVFEYAKEIKSNKYILSSNSVMISKLNPDTKRIWRPLCLSENPVCSTEFIVYDAFNPNYRDYLYSVIDSQAFLDYLCSHTTGSTNSRQRATPKATLDFNCILPTKDIVAQFCGIVTPMYNQISAGIIENQHLAELRDKLLPKLMNGEIDVSEVKI